MEKKKKNPSNIITGTVHLLRRNQTGPSTTDYFRFYFSWFYCRHSPHTHTPVHFENQQKRIIN